MLRHLRSLLRDSLRAYARFRLTRLRRCLDGRTQGQVEAAARATGRRSARVAGRRPAIRRVVVPAAATVHAVGASIHTKRINHERLVAEPPIPIVAPFKQVPMYVK